MSFTPSSTLVTYKNDFIAAMTTAGVAVAIITYSGSGDDGGFEHIQFYKTIADAEAFKAIEPDPPLVPVPESYRWHKGEAVATSWSYAGSILHDIVIDEYGLSGYWNDDGGSGTITIDAQAGTIELYHGYVESKTEYTEYEPF